MCDLVPNSSVVSVELCVLTRDVNNCYVLEWILRESYATTPPSLCVAQMITP